MSVTQQAADPSGVPAELRQDRIAEEIEAIGFARVTDLAERHGVSPVTEIVTCDFVEARQARQPAQIDLFGTAA